MRFAIKRIQLNDDGDLTEVEFDPNLTYTAEEYAKFVTELRQNIKKPQMRITKTASADLGSNYD